jgi:hypothetical protein
MRRSVAGKRDAGKRGGGQWKTESQKKFVNIEGFTGKGRERRVERSVRPWKCATAVDWMHRLLERLNFERGMAILAWRELLRFEWFER